MSNGPDIGVIGLGRMGGGIARRLHAAGRLAAVWDVDTHSRARWDPARVLPPGRMAAVCATILFVVPGSSQIEDCLDGAGGILAEDAPGQALVDLTTSDPARTRHLADRAAQAGRSYCDAGMTGGAQAADAGTLTLMVGGDGAAFARIRPVLDLIAARVFHLGDVGSGHTMKLIHNMICHTIFLATSEGCRAAERAGIDLSDAVAVLNAGNARSFISESRFPNHILPGTFDGRSTVSNLAKDLAMAERLERDLGLAPAYGALSAEILAAAVTNGWGGRDFTTLYRDIPSLLEGRDGEPATSIQES